MKKVLLGDVIVPVTGRAGSEAALPVYSVTKHSGFVPQAVYFKKRVASADTASYKVVRKDQFAYATIHLDEGSIGYAPEDCIVSPMYTVFATDTSRVDLRYLFAVLKSPVAIARYGTLGRGSAERRKAITLEALGRLEVALPRLDEQRRIATILDHADAIRTKRRQVLTHLDNLTQSIFHDMFGDPDDAKETISFGEVAGLSGGRNLVAEDSTADTPYRVLKISAVTSGQFKAHESKPLPPDYVPPARHLVRRGDLLMSRANTTELVGAVAYVRETPPNLALPDKVWRFDWKSEGSEPTFYHALLGTPSIRRRISKLSSGTGGSMKNVSKAKLESMPLPAVTVREQQDFAERAAGVGLQREALHRVLVADDELFASLQSRAFNGDL